MRFYVSFFIHWCRCRIRYVHNRRYVSGVFSPPVSGTFFRSSLILQQELFLNIVPAATACPVRIFLAVLFSYILITQPEFEEKNRHKLTIFRVFLFLWFHWPIRQIKNVFIPLSFHWRISSIIPDWETMGSGSFKGTPSHFPSIWLWSGNGGISSQTGPNRQENRGISEYIQTMLWYFPFF